MVPATLEFHKKVIGPRYVVSGTVHQLAYLTRTVRAGRETLRFEGQRLKSRPDPWPGVRRVVTIDRRVSSSNKGAAEASRKTGWTISIPPSARLCECRDVRIH